MRPKRCITNMMELRLDAMVARTQMLQKSPEYHTISHDELLADITQFQIDANKERKLERDLKAARLPFPSADLASLSPDITYQVEANYLKRICEGHWIADHQNLIVTGLDEKSCARLTCAVLRKVIEHGFRVRCFDVSSLLESCFVKRNSKLTGTTSPLIKFLDELRRPDVLFIRGLGLHPFSENQRADLSRIIQWRENTGGIVVTSPYQPKDWLDMLGNSPDSYQIRNSLTDQFHHFHLSQKLDRNIEDEYDVGD